MLKISDIDKKSKVYNCWLNYENCSVGEYQDFCNYIKVKSTHPIINTAIEELKFGLNKLMKKEPLILNYSPKSSYIFVGTLEDLKNEKLDVQIRNEILKEDGFAVKIIKEGDTDVLAIIGQNEKGVLYGVFYLLMAICSSNSLNEIEIEDGPYNLLRIINHWDNLNGEIERGYAGQSVFFKDNKVVEDLSRVKDYARLLASVGINGVVLNNVNVHKYETELITDKFLPDVSRIADVFRLYGIKIYLSINFAAPVEIGGLPTADPLDERVKKWWKEIVENIYRYIPDFGGFLVKADSEFRPGPFTYGRNHAEGANMLAEALKPHGGLVFWRAFVYNCMVDWRDRTQDRAKAAYENFKPLDGQFMDNVVLQIKYGPMDFQIREPVSPLFGAMEKTNVALELQITQEYTGQQKDLCYLPTMWKEILDFDTYAKGKGSTVAKVVNGSLFGMKYGGIVGVSNIGDSKSWTGHPLAQANLYGFGRLAWNPELSPKEIAEEWTKLTFGHDEQVINTIVSMLMASRDIYEKYTAPLGVGWMVNPGHHYGPNLEGYEYSHWGTYHYADYKGIGVDRTVATGTGYTAQYKEPIASMYENIETCPDELLLFFHHVPYTHKLKSGKTVIQHIYDTHFEGAEEAKGLKEKWLTLRGKIDEEIFEMVLERLEMQIKNAIEWRDVVNTYFYRKTGIRDVHNRKIYE
ncbi:Alpha-glucuronidase [Thermoanaerobacter mathranii subsp. mathranii str. A3]|uniref:Xylan alpha-1,2-glucuronidase n=1 Tax=Thermoanaerobacter mathranii subsp. mathranii (strain DSM 11426 / CCUG 53645 / CIP 108742 / A3) TaxID=583358 RepID=A0ABN3Z077_THEM3|nr:alpha-glucuronidase family glycosyl hydrolase [Thermoanaerobacter mathranii]ADH60031.1 Alpha-glucuronidase [Thermoanaerobacter mathranii subsp. mathranii str. A3]